MIRKSTGWRSQISLCGVIRVDRAVLRLLCIGILEKRDVNVDFLSSSLSDIGRKETKKKTNKIYINKLILEIRLSMKSNAGCLIALTGI
jgi:hypothetical protein